MGFFQKVFGTTSQDTKTTATEPTKGDFATAIWMHQRGELDPALSMYLIVAEELPEDGLAPFFAAAITSEKGNTLEAANDLRSLSQQIASTGETISAAILKGLASLLNPDRLPTVADMVATFGDSLKREGFLQESAVCFEIAVGLAPRNGNMLYKLGDTLHDLHFYEYAESIFQQALENAPHHWGTLYSYAVLLQDLGRDDEAISYYERAVKLNPTHVNCQNNYGAALLRKNRLEEALEHCSVAALLDAESPYVKINLGNIYLLMHDYEAARSQFTGAVSLNKNLALAYYGLASAEQSLKGEPERVMELYLKAIEANPAIPQVYQSLGKFLATEGNPDALYYFSRAVQLDNNLKGLHKDFANACLQLGKREEAFEHLKIAFSQDPDDLLLSDQLAKLEAAILAA